MSAIARVSLPLLLALLLGCGGQADQGAGEAMTSDAATSMGEATMQGAMTLEGTLGCGHCNHHIGDACSAAVQTADGAVFILDVDQGHELFGDRFSGKQVRVTGTVHDVEQIHHVKIARYEIL